MVKKSSYRINHQIKSREVRVVDDQGEQLGVMETSEALKLSQKRELDLVEVAPSAKPPVVRVLDYKRWLFQKEKEEGKKKIRTQLKELRIRPNIGDNDLEVRVRKAEEFLKDGDRVKLTVFFRGREIAHPEIGLEKIRRVTELLKGIGEPEKDPIRIGRGYEVTFIPSKANKNKDGE